jgi:hypothetical protein
LVRLRGAFATTLGSQSGGQFEPKQRGHFSLKYAFPACTNFELILNGFKATHKHSGLMTRACSRFSIDSPFTFCNFTLLNHRKMIINQAVITDIKVIILNAKDKAIRLVDHERTLMYWLIGQRILKKNNKAKTAQNMVITLPNS